MYDAKLRTRGTGCSPQPAKPNSVLLSFAMLQVRLSAPPFRADGRDLMPEPHSTGDVSIRSLSRFRCYQTASTTGSMHGVLKKTHSRNIGMA